MFTKKYIKKDKYSVFSKATQLTNAHILLFGEVVWLQGEQSNTNNEIISQTMKSFLIITKQSWTLYIK